MKVQDILRDRIKSHAKKPAIIFNDKEISFNELNLTVLKIANGLIKQGVKKGDKVAIFLPNYPEYIYSYLSIFSIGAVIVPLDFMLTEEEVINFINHSDTSVLIAKDKKGINFENIRRASKRLKKIVLLPEEGTDFKVNGFAPWTDLLKEEPKAIDATINDNDSSAIFYTSGSTGHPKGVLLNYGHLNNPVECIIHFLKPTDKDSYLCSGVPFSHIAGLDYMLFMLSFGSTLILMDRFHPLEALKNIEKYKATIYCIVPSMYVAILSLKDCDKFNLSSLRYAVVFGAPSSPVLLKRFNQLCPNTTLLNGWGMTETAAPNTYSPPDVNKISSIGPFGVNLDVKVVDDNGQVVKDGGQGELLLKGKAMMVAYYKEEELTRQTYTKDGWFKTGDVVRRDKDGLYYIVGRKKDMIKVSGEIVFASELEEVLHRHPNVQEVAVFGIPDELRGEVPKAYIVLKEKHATATEDLRLFAKEHLAHFKIPHVFEIRDSLPKNRTGKIDKEILIKEMKG